MSDTVKALVLDDTVTGAAEPVHFAGFPGLWVEGRPVAVTELGFESDDVALATVADLGLPLELTSVAPGDGLMPEVPNHVPAGVTPVFVGDELDHVVEPAPPADPFADAVKANADDVIASVEKLNDLPQLGALKAAELAGKNRSTVIAALDARTAQLAPDDPEGAGA